MVGANKGETEVLVNDDGFKKRFCEVGERRYKCSNIWLKSLVFNVLG